MSKDEEILAALARLDERTGIIVAQNAALFKKLDAQNGRLRAVEEESVRLDTQIDGMKGSTRIVAAIVSFFISLALAIVGILWRR